jgi:hypothetical protein
MIKNRIVAFVAGLALIAAVVGASANVAGSLAAETAAQPQAIACNNSGGSGGGC